MYRGENMARRVFQVHDVKAALVLFSAHDHADTPSILTTADHCKIACLELDKINHLSSFDVDLDGIVDSDRGVRVADRPAIVGHNVRNLFRSHSERLDTCQLVLRASDESMLVKATAKRGAVQG
jgi:hypothetical protein